MDQDPDQTSNKETEALKEKKETVQPVPFSTLLRYATCKDKLLIFIGTSASVLNGVFLPTVLYCFGKAINSISDPTLETDEMVERAKFFTTIMALCGLFTLVIQTVASATWTIVGQHQNLTFRNKYFSSLLNQEPGWYDTQKIAEIASSAALHCERIDAAIGNKVPNVVSKASTCFFSLAVAFYQGWHIALLVLCIIPFFSISVYKMIQGNIRIAKFSLKAYSISGGIAEQALRLFKVVLACNQERNEIEKYDKELQIAKEKIKKEGRWVGVAVGFVKAFDMYTWAVVTVGGSLFIHHKTVNPTTGNSYMVGDVITIFWNVLTGIMQISELSPAFKDLMSGKMACAEALRIIDRKPKINLNDPNATKLENLKGEIELVNVDFAYPSRKDNPVLKNLSLKFEVGKKTALVGPTGCGKSSIIQLIERYYDADSGQVLVDGQDIKGINLTHFRKNVGYVGQEPVLFAASIKDNLLIAKPDAKEQELILACKRAQAWEFIQKQDKKMDTFCGNAGAQLSGGQKQRLAIARAILTDPKILLLDEATSALDSKSEAKIQQTLEEICKGKTTITIAHRLSTIKDSDKIIVLKDGELIEQGNHHQLIKKKGLYYKLNKVQTNVERRLSQNLQSREDITKMLDKHNVQLVEEGSQGQESEMSIPSEPVIKQSGVYSSKKILTANNRVNSEDINLNVQDNQDPDSESDSGNLDELEELYMMKRKSTLSKQSDRPIDLDQEEKENESPNEDAQTNPGSKENEDGELSKEEKEKLQKYLEQNKTRLMDFQKGEMGYLAFAWLVSIIIGITFPMFAVIISDVMGILAQQDDDMPQRAREFSYRFLILGTMMWVLNFIQQYFFIIIEQGLVTRLKQRVFAKLMHIHPGWHDMKENNLGKIVGLLSSNIDSLKQLTGVYSSVLVQCMVTLVIGFSIAFYTSWRLTASIFIIIPIFGAVYFVTMLVLQGDFKVEDSAYKEANAFIVESTTNIKTVLALGHEKQMLVLYNRTLDKPRQRTLKKGCALGFSQGLLMCSFFLVYGFIMYFGSKFVADGKLTIGKMFKVFFSLVFSLSSVEQLAWFSPNFQKASVAIKKVFQILDTPSLIDSSLDQGIKPENFKGEIEFKNVSFSYPSRPNEPILRGLSLKLEAGKKIGLVGMSGCGKSTIFQLLMRFYDIDEGKGELLIDGISIKKYNISFLRQQFGIVFQEPALFDGTIKYNLAYKNKKVTNEEIDGALKIAEAYDVVYQTNFQGDKNDQENQGLERKVGLKGGQLSGGQKQRLAITRVLLSETKVLMFDEATSALDSATEKKVQENIDNAMKGKTFLVIAHRISTIKDSDYICVFQDGQIVERDTYQNLMNLRGQFYMIQKGKQIEEE